MRFVLRQLIPLVLVVAFADSALGQEMVPIDQAVVDLDQLSTGLRRVGTGLRVGGEHTSLYRLNPTSSTSSFSPNTNNPTFYRIAPGLQAQVARIDYLVQTGANGVGLNVQPAADGNFVEIISANTLFLLTPLPTPIAPPATPRIEHKLDYRVYGRIDGRVVTNRKPSSGRSWPTDSPLTPNDGRWSQPPQRMENVKSSAPHRNGKLTEQHTID